MMDIKLEEFRANVIYNIETNNIEKNPIIEYIKKPKKPN